LPGFVNAAVTQSNAHQPLQQGQGAHGELQTGGCRSALAQTVDAARTRRLGAAVGGADTPVPPGVIAPGVPVSVTVAVSPVRSDHAITVEYRVNGSSVRQEMALPVPGVNNATTPAQRLGSVYTKAMRIEFDVYALAVGGSKREE
jgi:hypothetical protein